jgi:hypothetical protein
MKKKRMKGWKACYLQKVTIRRLFLENVLRSAGRNSRSFKSMCCCWRDDHDEDKQSNIDTTPIGPTKSYEGGGINLVIHSAPSLPYEEENGSYSSSASSLPYEDS